MIINSQITGSGSGGGTSHTVTCTGRSGGATCHATSSSNPDATVPTYGTTATVQSGGIVCVKVSIGLKEGVTFTPAIAEFYHVYNNGTYRYYCFVMPDSDVTIYAN